MMLNTDIQVAIGRSKLSQMRARKKNRQEQAILDEGQEEESFFLYCELLSGENLNKIQQQTNQFPCCQWCQRPGMCALRGPHCHCWAVWALGF